MTLIQKITLVVTAPVWVPLVLIYATIRTLAFIIFGARINIKP